MNIVKYLVITPGPKKWNSKVTVLGKLSKSRIAANAVVLKLNLDLPDSLFVKPQLEASITVNSNQVSKPVIEPEVVQNIQEIINQQLGVDLKISVVEQKQ